MIMHHKNSAHRHKAWCLELKIVNIIKEFVYFGISASMEDSPLSLTTYYEPVRFGTKSFTPATNFLHSRILQRTIREKCGSLLDDQVPNF
jgi:hypothetical protein